MSVGVFTQHCSPSWHTLCGLIACCHPLTCCWVQQQELAQPAVAKSKIILASPDHAEIRWEPVTAIVSSAYPTAVHAPAKLQALQHLASCNWTVAQATGHACRSLRQLKREVKEAMQARRPPQLSPLAPQPAGQTPLPSPAGPSSSSGPQPGDQPVYPEPSSTLEGLAVQYATAIKPVQQPSLDDELPAAGDEADDEYEVGTYALPAHGMDCRSASAEWAQQCCAALSCALLALHGGMAHLCLQTFTSLVHAGSL